jgi:hypothetical protein
MSDKQTRRWPNLSAYGVTLGIIDLAGGKNRLVFSDETGKFGHIAKNMAFQRTRWPGLWVRDDTRLEASAFRPAFPLVKIEDRSNEDIGNEILSRIRDVVDRAKQEQLPGFSITGDYVGSDLSGTKSTDGGDLVDLSPLSLIAAAYPMGMNHLGQDVFESPDGKRFLRVVIEDKGRIVMEGQRTEQTDEDAGRFMRGTTPASLALAADGFVRSMAEGRVARVEDFAQFFRAVNEREMAEQDLEIGRSAKAIDVARVRRLAGLARNPDADAFGAALRLHEAAQYYTIIADKMTPLPVGIVMQHIATAMPEGSTVRIGSKDATQFSIFMDGAGAFKMADDGQPQDILLATSQPIPLERSFEIFGTSVARLDHSEVLQSLEQISPDGLGIFVVGGDGAPGRIGPASRRFLDALATHYKVEGIVDIDGNLTGTPGAPPQRIIVVGSKNATPGHGGLPASLPYVTDYESLWSWGDSIVESIKKPGSVAASMRGAVATDSTVEVNEFQAPYVPTSMLSDPAMMVPRNMASPLRRAMLEVLREHPHIDDYLGEQLQMTNEDLKESFSAEQADAIVLGLKRLETGLGFMEADQTGVGKGRVLAGIAASRALQKQPVVFLTEKAELFTDFWRDIEDIGAARLFQNIFIMNNDATITSTMTGDIIAKSAPRDVVEKTLRSMEFPPNVDIVFATYSQFNRDPIKAIKNSAANINLTSGIRTALSAKAKKMSDWANKNRAQDNKKALKEVSVEAYDVLTDADVLPTLPMEALKPLWIGKCVTDALLIMDESHVASGQESQTNLNVIHAVMRAKSVLYSSSTFARDGEAMGIYRRLFPDSVDVEGLQETLKKGGEPLQEALTAMLGDDGALVRREHDLSMLKFEMVPDIKRTKRNEKAADQLAEILSLMTALSRETREYTDAISEEMRDKLKDLHTDIDGNVSVGEDVLNSIGVVQRSPIGNSLYTIMRTFVTILKTDLAAEEAVEAMRQGQKPVLVITHTMEAEINRSVERVMTSGDFQKTDDGIILEQPGFQRILLDTLESLLQVKLDGKDLEMTKSAKFSEIIREIEKKIMQFPNMPTSPIDVLRQAIEKAGYSVAELSGRKKRVTYMANNKIMVSPISPKERKKAIVRFNNGDAQAMILTGAGSTGISLHASPRFINQNQRVLIEVEVAEDVVARTQFFGRVNRNGQLSHPIIKTLSSNLPAENRVLALNNNKMRKMSASVTGDRNNAALTKDIADILNTLGNKVAINFLQARPELAIKLDVNLPEKTEDEDGEFIIYGDKYVKELFFRLILLRVVDQRAIIDELTTEFTNLVSELDAIGENPLRPKFYDVNAVKVKSEILEIVSQASDVETDDDLAEYGGLSVSKKDAKKHVRKSTFDHPVNISEIEYTVTFEPMPVKTIHKEIKIGRAVLEKKTIENYGDDMNDLLQSNPDAFFNNLCDIILDRKDVLMNDALSKKHANVAAALADESWNLVKSIQWKADELVNVLSSMRIGSTFEFIDKESGEEVKHAIVVGMTVPKEFLAHYSGRYEIDYVTPGSRRVKRSSAAALLKMDGFKIHDQFNEATLTAYRERKAGSYDVSRSVLDGNLFRAAEMSLQAGVGTQAMYTDSHGMSHRAVVLPFNADARSFTHLPLRVHDPELAASFYRDINFGKMYSLSGAVDKKSKGSNFNKSMNRGMSVARDNDDLIISVPGTRHWEVWLRNHPDLMAVTGPFGGTREALFASVPMDMADDLIQEIYKTGTTLYAHADTHASRVKKVNNNAPAVPTLTGAHVSKTETLSARAWFMERIASLNPHATSTEEVSPLGIDPMAAEMGKGKKMKSAA